MFEVFERTRRDIEKMRQDIRMGKSLKRFEFGIVMPQPAIIDTPEEIEPESESDYEIEYREIITGAKYWHEEFDCFHLAVESGACATIASGAEKPPSCFAMDDLSNRCPFYLEAYDEELD